MKAEDMHEGMVVIATENHLDVLQGDRLTVACKQTPCCGGFTAKDRNPYVHYNHKNFEPFPEHGCEHSSAETAKLIERMKGLDRDKIIKVFQRFMAATATSHTNGYMPVHFLQEELWTAMDYLKLRDDFLNSYKYE